MADVTDVLANPSFNPEQFLHNVATLYSKGPIVELLFSTFPELMLMDHGGQPIILAFVNKPNQPYPYAISHNIAVHKMVDDALASQLMSEELADKLFDAFHQLPAAQSRAATRMSIQYVEELIDAKVEQVNWIELGYGLIQSNRLQALREECLIKMLEMVAPSTYNANDGNHICKRSTVLQSLIAKVPIDHTLIVSLAESRLSLGRFDSDREPRQIAGCICTRLSVEKRLAVMAHCYHDTAVFSKTIIDSIKNSIRDLKTGMRCPLCTKRLRNLSGLTMHLEQMHEIKNRWRRP